VLIDPTRYKRQPFLAPFMQLASLQVFERPSSPATPETTVEAEALEIAAEATPDLEPSAAPSSEPAKAEQSATPLVLAPLVTETTEAPPEAAAAEPSKAAADEVATDEAAEAPAAVQAQVSVCPPRPELSHRRVRARAGDIHHTRTLAQQHCSAP